MSSTVQATLTIALLSLIGMAIYFNQEKKGKKERYQELTSSEKLGDTQHLTVDNFANYVFARPNFKPGLPGGGRFDPYRTGSGTIRDKEAGFPAGAYVSPFGTQASEAYPVNYDEMQGASQAADYTTIADMSYNDNKWKGECKQTAGLRRQYDSSMKGKSGMAGYTTPDEMLPTPSVRSCVIEDPRNPDVYTSSNTIGFKSRGGRASRSGHDHIRGIGNFAQNA